MADFSLGIDFDRLVKEGANDLGDAFGKVAGAAGNGLERIASLGRAGTSDTIGRIAGYGGRGGGDTLARISQYGGYGGGGNLDFFAQMGGTDPFAAFNRTQANMAALTPPPTEKPLTVPTGAGGGGNTGATGAGAWLATQRADSPLIPIADELAAYAVSRGVDPGAVFGMLRKESQYGADGALGIQNNNPGNIMAEGADPANGKIILRQYGTLLEGTKAIVDNLAQYNTTYNYVAKHFGRESLTLEDMMAIYYVGPQAYMRYGLNANDAGGQGPGGNGTVQEYIDKHVRPVQQSYNSRPGAQVPAADPANLVGRAATLLGTPYQLGGRRTHVNTPQAGIDCSEFTAWIFEGQGIDLPWNAAQQARATQPVQQGQLQVGDLVFFHSTYNSADGEYITHVGMYAGDGKMIHAGTGGVQYANLSDPYWQQHYAGAGRVKR